MSRRDDEHSIRREPHLQGRPAQPDPSEARAAAALRRESSAGGGDQASGESVYEEPDIFPGREGEIVTVDWSCRNCGYNLRGRPLERVCPECGQREWYRPPPDGVKSYRSWLQQRQAETSPRAGWRIALLAAVIGGPVAVLTALFSAPGGGLFVTVPLMVIVFAPVVEEIAKIMIAAWTVETRPYLFTAPRQIVAATAAAAVAFAAIENVLYLGVYIPNPSLNMILWRWTVCVGLHLGCTLVATQGVVAMWREAITEQRRPRAALGAPWLLAAMVLHGAYNAAAWGAAWMF